MIRPLIRKAGKVPKEAGLDADAAGDENGGGRRSLYSTMHARTHARTAHSLCEVHNRSVGSSSVILLFISSISSVLG